MTDTPYSKLVVSGADALEFLQGQLTIDLQKLGMGDSQRAGWCNPKGRVICLFDVTATDEGFSLSLPSELADDVLRRLTMFRFRSKVDFELQTSSDEGRLEEKLHDGVAEIWQAQSEKFTPHMLNLDLIGAIDFEKGCYTGQEIVARTHYRGASKRRCLRFESTQPVSPGDKVSDGDRDVGEVLNAIGNDLLAVVPVDKADSGLTVAGASLVHLPLPYMNKNNSGENS
jgi:folate-binding protein YgfZ